MVAGTFLCSILAVVASGATAQAATCSGSLQAKIDAAPVGGTVTADACIYREQVKITKPLTLIGQPGSEIRGSDVWTDWTQLSDGDYRSARTVPNFYQEDVSCEKGYPTRCAWPEQVFIDGSPLTQVTSGANPALGEFKADGNRRIVLGEAPGSRVVEVTVRKHWITGTSSADGVTIQGFTMKHAATDWRCGGVQSREPSTGSGATFDSCRNGQNSGDGDRWSLLDSELSYAHGALVSLRGENALIEGNVLHHGGELGIHNPGDGSVVRANEVAFNNTEHFCIRPATDYCQVFPTDGDASFNPDPLTESGGMKIAGGKGNILVTENNFHHNYGNGIWCDVGCHDMTYSNNRSHHNARRGIFFEISYRADIYSNVLYENGWKTPEGLNGAGLEVGTSDAADVHDNTLAWNADGIVAKCSSGRDNASCENNSIHDNTILQEENGTDGWPGLALSFSGQSSFFAAASNNRGAGNDYYYDHAEDGHVRFAWSTKYSSLASFNATPGEEGGRYLTRTEKDTVTANEGIPANPEPH